MYGFFLDGGETVEYVLVLGSNLLEGRLPAGNYAHEFHRELKGIVGGKHLHAAILLVEDCEGGEEVGPPVTGGKALDLSVQAGAEDALHGLVHKGVEVDLLSVPDGACHVVVEIRSQAADVGYGHVCILAVTLLCSELYVGHHKLLLVGLVAVARHRDPGEVLAVRAPDGIGVISALLRDCDGASGEHVIDVDGCIGAEGVLFAHLLPAAVGYVPAVGSPIQLLYAAERLGGELEAVVASEYVEGIVRSNLSVNQRSHIAAGDFGYPMVPVAVHKVLGSIGLGFVERRIGIGGLDHCRVLDG